MAEPILPEMQDISRQRDLAKLLLQKGMSDNLQGQMVSGRYVGASPLQGIANVYAAYKGNQMLRDSDRKQTELANMLRQQTMQDIQDYGQAIKGSPEVTETTYGAGMEGPTVDFARPAVAPNPEKGLGILLGSKSPQSQALAQALLADQLKTQVLPEGGTIIRGGIGGSGQTITSGPKKTTEQKEYELAKEQGYKGSFMDYQTDLKRAGANNLVVNTGQSYTSAFGKGIADQDLNKFTAAQGAPKQIESAQKTIELLDKGAITGFGAEYKLNLARALNVTGAKNADIIKNTEQLVANRGQAVLNNIKTSGLGAGQGFTDKDRQFLENVVGGTITLNDKTLRDLARIEMSTAKALADNWNSRVSSIPKEALAGTGIGRVDLPTMAKPTGVDSNNPLLNPPR